MKQTDSGTPMLNSSSDPSTPCGSSMQATLPKEANDHSQAPREDALLPSDDSSVTMRELASPDPSLLEAPPDEGKTGTAQRNGNSDDPEAVDAPTSYASRRSLTDRTVKNMTVDGLRHSFLTLTSTALGGGLLAASFVMEQVGLGLGILMFSIGALMAYLGTVALMRISTEIGEASYAGLFSHCAGPKAGPILDTMLFIFGNGCCINYLVFLSDFIPALVTLAVPDSPEWCRSRWLAILASCVVLLPMCLQKELAALRHMTPVSILSLVYVAVVIAARCSSFYSEHAHATDHAEYGEVEVFDFSANVFNAFSICVFAFNCHINVVPVAGRLIRPTRQRIRKVASWVNVLQLAFYLLIGVTGYLTFLAKTPGDILKGFKDDDPFMAVGRVLLSFTMIVAIALNLNPTVRSGLQIRDYFFPDSPVLQPSPRSSPQSSPVTGPRSLTGDGSPQSNDGPQSLVPMTFNNNEDERPRIVLTILCMIVQVLVAIAVPDVADVIGILGATVATAMMMIIPAYCMGKVLPYSVSTRFQQAALLFFACVGIASVPVKFLQKAGVLQK